MSTTFGPSPLSPCSAAAFTREPAAPEITSRKQAMQHTVLYSPAHVDIAYNRLHHYLYCNWKSVPAGLEKRSRGSIAAGGSTEHRTLAPGPWVQ